ncbi:TrbC/VirB2 family protein [Patescibacteria group bacterium]|nr:TrbC/VirB2 family protein [Patescibacteria group bacterium]
MKKRIKILFIIFAFLGLFLVANLSFAQSFGTEEVELGLEGALASAEDPRIIAGRFIQFALGFLGILAVLLIMYAGFLWMSSGGDEEKISRAKKILINGVIGLVIILSSWALATFILNRFSNVIGNNSTRGLSTSSPLTFSNPGAGAIGNCAIENIYPADNQKDVPRNSSILITFKEELDLNSVCVNDEGLSCSCDNSTTCNKINPKVFRLFKTDLGDACSTSCPSVNTNISELLVSTTADKKTIILSPLNYLGSASGYTSYDFKISGDLRKEDGSSMFLSCSVNDLETSFVVSDILDLSPPIIQSNKIFPPADNEADLLNLVSPAVTATAELELVACPLVFSPASVVSVSPSGEAEEASVSLDYKGKINHFQVSVPTTSETKAQLFNGSNGALLGVADWNLENKAVFPGYLTIQTSNYEAGNFWDIIIRPEILADTLKINNSVYTFSDNSVNNNIAVVNNCQSDSIADLTKQAELIQAVISGEEDINSSLEANKIKLSAKVAGLSGNNIAISAIGSDYVMIKPFSGGLDKKDLSQVLDKEDKPRNSAIQLSFNEPINPVTVSGSADELADFIRVVNYDEAARGANSSCENNSDCLSYKCDNGICRGDYLNGNFSVSSNYRTVEFLSNEECGINGCGEKIYCLPANSNLKVEIKAADLKVCSDSFECAGFSPFDNCSPSELDYNTCQNLDNKNYPLANLEILNGIVDLAYNSLDANRDDFSTGPLSFYQENNKDLNFGDNYSWSFFIGNEINLSPPKITYISPTLGQLQESLSEPIKINFDKLMLGQTLKSGSLNIFNGKDTFNHKLINLKSSSPSPFGFWIKSDNIDVEPFDSEADFTSVTINHSPFAQSMTFSVQVGSGVKDIYQNCYKASIGPDCPTTEASCCFGTPTTELDEDGNCIF